MDFYSVVLTFEFGEVNFFLDQNNFFIEFLYLPALLVIVISHRFCLVIVSSHFSCEGMTRAYHTVAGVHHTYYPLMRPSVRLSVRPSQLKGFQNFEK